MTRDEITRMAREAGFVFIEQRDGSVLPEHSTLIESFAALVAAAERKACAQICVDMSAKPEFCLEIQDRALLAAAKKILACGEKGQS